VRDWRRIHSRAICFERFRQEEKARVHKVLFIVLLFLIGITAVSCARRLVGSPIKEENIPKIVVGKTTRAEILRLFGSPYRVESSDIKRS
jgi:hypothetical protein